jgi:protein-disulfide isomerase
LDTNKFDKCLDSGEKKAQIDKDTAYGQTLGVQGTPGFFINGQFLAGAFPFSLFKEIIDKQIDGSASSECATYSTELQKYCSDPANKAFDPTTKEVDVKGLTSTGAKNGKVTIVEFSDFECPYCIRAFSTVEQILKEYKSDVKLYFKQYPLVQIHPNALKAAEASLCAADQGKFWEWHNKIFGLEAAGQGQ